MKPLFWSWSYFRFLYYFYVTGNRKMVNAKSYKLQATCYMLQAASCKP